MSRELWVGARASVRRQRVTDWLGQHPADQPVLLVAHSLLAAQEMIRDAATRGHFGWRGTTLDRLAVELATAELARGGGVPATRLALTAVAAQVIAGQAPETLGRFAEVAGTPGFAGALAATLEELRLAGVTEWDDAPDLGRLAGAFDRVLLEAGLVDRRDVFRAARTALSEGAASAEVAGSLIFLDLPIPSLEHEALVRDLSLQAASVLAVIPSGNDRDRDAWQRAVDTDAAVLPLSLSSGLASVQTALFADDLPPERPDDGSVEFFHAPGESREGVEIARRILRAADNGLPFDRMAVLLRAPELHGDRVLEGLRRAGIPSWSSRGVRRPDAAGRSFLALLACRAEGLSARRFAEYLSLGEAGYAKESPNPQFVNSPPLVGRDDDVPDHGVDSAVSPSDDSGAQILAPRQWERFLVEAAVIGGRERWVRRLDGLAAQWSRQRQVLQQEETDSPRIERFALLAQSLQALRGFALPILDRLEGLPERGLWGQWIDSLSELATHTLRRPERVVALLAELRPMASVGPVTLEEVRVVIGPRLSELLLPEESRRYGKVFVGSIDEARGLEFDLVFVPGLAERVFPRKVSEDPLCLDVVRRRLSGALPTKEERVADERARLHLAVGAATTRVALSWSRLDESKGRPSVPSFYGLDLVRAARGQIARLEDLVDAGRPQFESRLGWPAPHDPLEAIDEAEHDLATLRDLMAGSGELRAGAARYLMSANPHLARALRARGRRWIIERFTPADGFVDPSPEGRRALAAHQLEARSYSPTALQGYAACPYRFFLSAIHRLSPREVPEPVEQIDPLSRGALIHEVQYALLTDLRSSGDLPIPPEKVSEVWERMEPLLVQIADRFRDDLAPAIERIWVDAVAEMRADLREWVRQMADDRRWIPERFELSFGLQDRGLADAASRPEPVVLDGGLQLRGAIDMVERSADGIRVTDHKTGSSRRTKVHAVIQGGQVLQPVFYALAAEHLFPETKVLSGRLWFCSSRGGFAQRDIPLDDQARSAAKLVAETVGGALREGFFPAAPAPWECTYCDFRTVCGPHEQDRVARKKKGREQLAPLLRLRESP